MGSILALIFWKFKLNGAGTSVLQQGGKIVHKSVQFNGRLT